MTEKEEQMLLFNPKKIAAELGVSQQKVSRMLVKLGAKKHSCNTYIIELDSNDTSEKDLRG